MNKYRLTHYAYRAWQIEEWVEPKGKTEPHWGIIKYPGSLPNAARGLLDLVVGEMPTATVEELIEAVEKAEKRVVEMLENVVVERGKL